MSVQTKPDKPLAAPVDSKNEAVESAATATVKTMGAASDDLRKCEQEQQRCGEYLRGDGPDK